MCFRTCLHSGWKAASSKTGLFFFFLKAITFSLESLCYLENKCLKCDTVFASRSHFSCCFPGILAESSGQAIMCLL